jgi:uncharacterized membrane protein YeaQ/YmgE (transglycosylase-associated protein family)
MRLVLGILGGIVGLAAFAPYFVSAWTGETRPSRTTWLIWSVVSSVLAASYVSSGARQTAFVPISYAVGSWAIAALALVKGTSGWSRLELWCLLGAVVGLLAWAVSGTPMTALVANLVVDFCGAVPTVGNVMRDPSSESAAAWCLFLAANTFNLLALRSLRVDQVLYPAYLFVLSLIVTSLALRRSGSAVAAASQ